MVHFHVRPKPSGVAADKRVIHAAEGEHVHPTGRNQNDLGNQRRLGLAVSKSVGNAVTRNSVKRRFRVLAKAHENLLPESCDVVMRAKPSAATADFSALDQQVNTLFSKVTVRVNKATLPEKKA